jgi:hypothetical protein
MVIYPLGPYHQLLKAGEQYEVQMEDRRPEMFELLREDEQQLVQQMFEQCDPQRTGVVHRCS